MSTNLTCVVAVLSGKLEAQARGANRAQATRDRSSGSNAAAEAQGGNDQKSQRQAVRADGKDEVAPQ